MVVLKNYIKKEKKLKDASDNQVEDCLMSRFLKKERLVHLKIHRASMIHGCLWQDLFVIETSYINISKLDLKSDVAKEYIELKNKTTTDNSDSKQHIFSKLVTFSKKNPSYSCILGFINSPKPIKQRVLIDGYQIELLSSDFLFERIWGSGWKKKNNLLLRRWTN